MSKPLVVSIPHGLGKDEARRRLETGFTGLKQQFGQHLTAVQDTWSGDRMDFKLAAMGQQVTGHLVVKADTVDLEVNLPFLLAMMAEKAKTFIQKQGHLMLEKK
jgi:putative polyhydroxyalkanoate system protein